MVKKITTLILIALLFSFNFNVKVEAAFPSESFQVDFNAVLTPFQTADPKYYQFDSVCVNIPEGVDVLSIQSLSNPNNLYTTKYRHPNDLHTSRINYFSDISCTVNNNSSHSIADRFFQFNDDTGLLGDKPYVFNIGNIANHYNISGYTPVRSRSFKVSFASNIDIDFLIDQQQAGDPYEDQVAVSTFFSYSTPNIVKYVDGFNITTRYFINHLPANPTPSRTGYQFEYWRNVNGERQFGQTTVNDTSLIGDDGVYTLYSYYTRIATAGEEIIPSELGGVYDPLDTILFNTGFLNNGGVLLLYFILAVLIAVMAWKFKLNSLIAIVLNILLTSFFLILGYLPLYTSVLLIAFYVIAIISINKGGFLNE